MKRCIWWGRNKRCIWAHLIILELSVLHIFLGYSSSNWASDGDSHHEENEADDHCAQDHVYQHLWVSLHILSEHQCEANNSGRVEYAHEGTNLRNIMDLLTEQKQFTRDQGIMFQIIQKFTRLAMSGLKQAKVWGGNSINKKSYQKTYPYQKSILKRLPV